MDGEALAYLPHGCGCCGGQLAYVQDWEPPGLYTPAGEMQSPPGRMQGGDDADVVIVLSPFSTLSSPSVILGRHAPLSPPRHPSTLPRNGTKRQGRVGRPSVALARRFELVHQIRALVIDAFKAAFAREDQCKWLPRARLPLVVPFTGAAFALDRLSHPEARPADSQRGASRPGMCVQRGRCETC